MEWSLYYLIMIRNGFGTPVSVGAEEELEAKKTKLEKLAGLSDQEADEVPAWERVGYDIVPKWEWDIEHCPLMPVDLSEKSQEKTK
jgi:hypothetical protein